MENLMINQCKKIDFNIKARQSVRKVYFLLKWAIDSFSLTIDKQPPQSYCIYSIKTAWDRSMITGSHLIWPSDSVIDLALHKAWLMDFYLLMRFWLKLKSRAQRDIFSKELVAQNPKKFASENEAMATSIGGRIDKCQPPCIPTGHRFLSILPH